MKILYKIMLFGLTIVLIMFVVGYTGLMQLKSLNKGVEKSNSISYKMINETIPLIKETVLLEQSLFDVKIKMRNLMIVDKKDELKDLENEFNDIYTGLADIFPKLKDFEETNSVEEGSKEIQGIIQESIKNKKELIDIEGENETGVNNLLAYSDKIEDKIVTLEENYKSEKDKETFKTLKKIIRLTEFQLKRKKKIVNNKSLNDVSVAESLGSTLAISTFFYPGGVGKDGYVFVLDKDKNVLKHPYLKEIDFKDKIDKKSGNFTLKNFIDDKGNKRDVYVYYKKTKYRDMILLTLVYNDNVYNLTNYKVLRNNYLELIGLTKDSLVLKGNKYREAVRKWEEIYVNFIKNINSQKSEKVNDFNLKNYTNLENSLKIYSDMFKEVNSYQNLINIKLSDLKTLSNKVDRILESAFVKIVAIRAQSQDQLKEDSDQSQLFIKKVQKQSGIGAGIVKVFIGIGVLTSIALTLLLTFVITTPIKYLQKLMDKAARGDLRIVSKVNTNDELKMLSDSFNTMIGGMKDLIKGSGVLAHDVEEESMLLSSTVVESQSASNSIIENINMIKSHAEENALKLDSFSYELKTANDNMNRIKDEALNSSEASKESRDISQEGKIMSENIKGESEKVSKNSKEVKDLILELNSEITNISEFLLKINNISEQTDMLALNAAIEAARAGEAGKGFAVVAQEIRVLSSQTNEIAQKISEFVSDIEKNSNKIVTKVSASEKVIENVRSGMNEMIEKLNSVVEHSIETSEKMINISNMSISQFDSFENIQKDINEINGETKQTLEEIRSVNVAIEEQNKTSKYITEASETLNEKIENLNDLIKKFQL